MEAGKNIINIINIINTPPVLFWDSYGGYSCVRGGGVQVRRVQEKGGGGIAVAT